MKNSLKTDVLTIRLCGIFLMLILTFALSRLVFNVVTVGLAFSHFLVSFLYSRRQIQRILFRGALFVLPFAGLLVLSIYQFYFFSSLPDIAIYFGLHFALTETYLVQSTEGRLIPGSTSPYGSSIDNCLRFLFVFASYMFCLRSRFHNYGGYSLFFLLVAGISFGLVYSSFLMGRQRSEGRYRELQKLVNDAPIWILVVASFVTEMSFFQLVFFHVATWIGIPGYKFARLSYDKMVLRKYILVTFLSSIFFLTWIFISVRHSEFGSFAMWQDQTVKWAYLHITTSFAFSNLNPLWIRRIFNQV